MIDFAARMAKKEKLPNISGAPAGQKTITFWTHAHGDDVLLVSDTSYNAKPGSRDIRTLYPKSRIFAVHEGQPGFRPDQGGDVQLILVPALQGPNGALLHNPEALSSEDAQVVGVLHVRHGTNNTTFFQGDFHVASGELCEATLRNAAQVKGVGRQAGMFLSFVYEPVTPTRSYTTKDAVRAPVTSEGQTNANEGEESDDIPF